MEPIILITGSLLFVVSVVAIFLCIKIISLRQRIKLLVVALSRVQDLVSKENKDSKDNDVHQENFIKFLSDSRDWAYQYIEDVQKGLSEFVDNVEPEISYFDEYGLIGDAYPHYHSMKKISQEYKKLKKMLPEGEHH